LSFEVILTQPVSTQAPAQVGSLSTGGSPTELLLSDIDMSRYVILVTVVYLTYFIGNIAS